MLNGEVKLGYSRKAKVLLKLLKVVLTTSVLSLIKHNNCILLIHCLLAYLSFQKDSK